MENCKLPVIEKVFLINPKDVVVEDGLIIRMKRKYGKHKREVYVMNCQE